MEKVNGQLRKQLHAFVEVDHQGTWAKTATALDVLEITVQSRINKLETWLNDLIVRHTGNTHVRLTRQGHIFLTYARYALQESRDRQLLEVALEGRQNVPSLKTHATMYTGVEKYEEGRHIIY